MSLDRQDTLASSDRAVVAACRRLHAAIDALDQRAADLLGISRGDLRCLNLLENGPVSPKLIGQALGLTSGSVTALVDRLQRRGYVERQPDPKDRRGVYVAATRQVYDTIGRLYQECALALTATVNSYAPDERAAAVLHLNDAATAWERSAASSP